VRFSNFAGIPDLADNHGLASPHGLAIKFKLPDGSQTDIVSHSFNGFPSPTAGDFHQLLLALGASGPDAAKPTALDTYLGSHPVAKAFLTAPKPAPVSYGTLPYFGVNTFKFINSKGDTTLGRYQFIPLAGSHNLPEEKAAAAAPNYLADEIQKRVKQEPVKFKVLVQVADKGDKLDDPSIAWPDSRRQVELGTLEINRVVADSDAAQKKLLFLPNALTSGIEVQDPMINVRGAAYPVSFSRRSK
jgi:catalase